MCTSLATHSACCAQISVHPFASSARKIHINSSRSSQKFSSSLVVNEKERRTSRPTVSRTPSSRVSLMCRAAKDNNNNNNNNNVDADENPFAALQSMRGTLVDKPELAVKKEVKRTSTNIDEFGNFEMKTKKNTTPTRASAQSAAARSRTQRRRRRPASSSFNA
jgi:hypothetical protein